MSRQRAEFEAGIRQMFPRLRRYCLVVSGSRDAADDLAQSTMLRALERADQFQPGTHLDRWLFRIAQRLWINEMRTRRMRQGGGVVSIETEDLAGLAASSETNLFARDVLREVMRLTEAQRAAVLLVYVEGYRYREAAEILEIPIGTVMSRLATARARLSARFAAHARKKGAVR